MIHLDSILPQVKHNINRDLKTTAVGANGQSLDIQGLLELEITLGEFKTAHQFTVVHNLTVDCLLGADFLIQYQAIIDCSKQTLKLGTKGTLTPIIGNSTHGQAVGAVSMSQTLTVPGRSVMLVFAKVGKECLSSEVLVEPDDKLTNPKHLLVARSLSVVGSDNTVVLQVMNTSSSSITLHQGSRIASWVAKHNIMVVTKEGTQLHLQEESAMDWSKLDVGPGLMNVKISLIFCTNIIICFTQHQDEPIW